VVGRALRNLILISYVMLVACSGPKSSVSTQSVQTVPSQSIDLMEKETAQSAQNASTAGTSNNVEFSQTASSARPADPTLEQTLSTAPSVSVATTVAAVPSMEAEEHANDVHDSKVTKKIDMVESSTDEYTIGSSVFTLAVTKKTEGPLFIAMHDDEQEAALSAKWAVHQWGGTLLEFKNGEERNIKVVSRSGKSYLFDPNRVFSDEGIRRTLKGLNRRAPSEAFAETKLFVQQFIQKWQIRSAPILLSAHNNTEGSLTIHSYKKGRAGIQDAYVNNAHDPDDFFYVTVPAHFAILKAEGFNVVLQGEAEDDDGSLSEYAHRARIPYINIETQRGHLLQQRTMIRTVLDKILKRPTPLEGSEELKIIERPIVWNDAREKLTLEYRKLNEEPGATSIFIDPNVIVLHATMGATAESAWAAFNGPTLSNDDGRARGGKLNTSSHFIVERDGTVFRTLPEDLMTRQCVGINRLSIGIENVGGTADLPLTEAQAVSNEKLVRYLVRAYPRITHLIGHHEYLDLRENPHPKYPYFSSTNANYEAWEKQDPGPEFMEKVREKVLDLELLNSNSQIDPTKD